MVAELDLPRSAWETHVNYPDQILLLRSHASFRTVSRELVERAENGGDPAAIRAVFRWWRANMHGHERYEEGKLYPFLEHRWGLRCDDLSAGHRALSEAEAVVHAAQPEALAQALEEHDRVLSAHLDAEEELVIPALLALTREEFEDYCALPLSVLLRSVPCHADSCRVCAPRNPGEPVS